MQTTSIRSAGSKRSKVGREIGSIALNIFSTLLAIGFMFPFLWSLSTSLKTVVEVHAFPPSFLPKVPQFVNYYEAWTSIQFGRFFINSVIVTAAAVVGSVVSSTLVAYGFARLRFPGREVLFLICLSGMMMPVYVTIIPLFLMFRAIGWIDTLKPLIVPSFFAGAFGIFFMRQFIMTIPFELDESALIDGASRPGDSDQDYLAELQGRHGHVGRLCFHGFVERIPQPPDLPGQRGELYLALGPMVLPGLCG